MEGFEDIIKEFLVESYESLDRLDDDLLNLEDHPGDQNRIAGIFRTVHSIKGTSGFLAFPKLERVAHHAENVLVPLRDGDLMLTRPITDALLETVDAIRSILQSVEQGIGEGEANFEALVHKLSVIAATDAIATSIVSDPATESVSLSHPLCETSVRIEVDLLDRMVNLVGELVLSRNQIIQHCRLEQNSEMITASQRLNAITSELQETVLKTRMQPIGNTWNKLPRMVRDLAAACGKRVQVLMEGAETEVDKSILEAIKDPLTHIVRNAIDHGIEAPEVRVASGKPALGTLHLSAFHEGGQMIIEIRDDGAGIAFDRVREQVVRKGLFSKDHAATLSDRELTQLILMPGFSTATTVNNVSGRGVGMDVVSTNLHSIGGAMEIVSKLGQGTLLRMKIPLTLAIIPALLIKTAGEQFAIPQANLLELIRLDQQRIQQDLHSIQQTPVLRLRDQLIPLVYLDQHLKLTPLPNGHSIDAAMNIAILIAEGQRFGLVVDEITDTHEIVVKPLGFHFHHLETFAGATIMGDGTVTLILDAIGIARSSNVLTDPINHHLPTEPLDGLAEPVHSEPLLIVDCGNENRAALRLCSVVHLENFPVTSVERVEGQHVVQYRGHVIPILAINDTLEPSSIAGQIHSRGDSLASEARLQTVVLSDGQQSVGIVVEKFLDIIQHRSSSNDDVPHPVILGRITPILDVTRYLRPHTPSCQTADTPSISGSERCCVL